MGINKQIADWLENRAVTPAYSGWVLAAVALCFFGAAINTMAGWLYVLSGISFALLGMAAVLSTRSLLGLSVRRHSIEPVSAGDRLLIELEIENHSNQPKSLLQVQALLPFVLAQPVQAPIEVIAPHGSYRWIYHQLTQRRGVYRWQTVQLRTANPLGLFWCRRPRDVPARAIVYPTVLPLLNCPLVDEMRQEDSAQFYSLHNHRFQTGTSGLTRSLRPYRVGDPTRLIHWRTSARYGELRVRELEVITGGQEVVICLDNSGWQPDDFEQAVIAAASLYFYAHRTQLNVKLWTGVTGLVQGERVVLEALAATEAVEELGAGAPPNVPIIWLSQNSLSLSTLPSGSRWVMWPSSSPQLEIVNRDWTGILIQAEQPLQLQLQKSLR